MPKCAKCQNHVPAAELKLVHENPVCKKCRQPTEVVMAEKADRKKVVSFHIYEIPTKDGGVDHEIEADIVYAGLSVNFTTTFDQVREFFTQKRAPGSKATLKAVK